MKKLLSVTLFFLSTFIFTQSVEAQELGWPRIIESNNYKITLYQPQLETLEGNLLKGRMAISIKDPKKNVIFGALWFDVTLKTDKYNRTAVLTNFEIPKIIFPDVEDEDKLQKLRNLIISDFETTKIEMSLDRITASLESVEAENSMSENFKNEAPDIYFRSEPTVLVSIDGEPKLKKAENSNFEYVVNTAFLITKKGNSYFIKGEYDWYTATKLISSDWKITTNVPNDIQKFAEKSIEKDENAEEEANSKEAKPKLIVVSTPSELIVTTGEMVYEPIKNTNLLYVTNSESDIIMDINSQQHFILINGRWYASKKMNDESWNFVEPDNLPKEFSKIPDEGSIASVRVSVPGTDEAKEAVYEQYIPQTAEVDRKTASAKVEYDGNPEFEEIEGTNMSYALNTKSSVIKEQKLYYLVDDGIWFVSNSPNGPWTVSDKRPSEVENIPPSVPVYTVKYVYIYESTPEVVYVGYTPGYYNSYVYGGVVVYGTGYYYRPWYRHYYYPRPVTFGFGVHYNPYTGWGFSVGISFGWFTISSHHHHHYWGPAGYRHGYRHGYHHGYHHGYRNGYHRGYAAGYARGRYDSNNIYRQRNNGIKHTSTNYSRRNSEIQKRSNSNRRATTQNNVKRSNKKNNVYTDRNGNVYQRDKRGNYEAQKSKIKNSSTRNSSSNRNASNRSTRNTNTRQTPSSRSRQELDRSHNSRTRGNTNYNKFNKNRNVQKPSYNRGTTRSSGATRSSGTRNVQRRRN